MHAESHKAIKYRASDAYLRTNVSSESLKVLASVLVRRGGANCGQRSMKR